MNKVSLIFIGLATSTMACSTMGEDNFEDQLGTTEQGLHDTLSGTASGSGAIIGATYLANGNVGIFELTETQNWTGDISGVRAQAEPESAVFELNTGEGTYSATFDFNGTIDGTPCSGVVVEFGVADLFDGSWSGAWKFLYNDCGYDKIGGTFSAQGVFTSEFEYDFTASYVAWAR